MIKKLKHSTVLHLIEAQLKQLHVQRRRLESRDAYRKRRGDPEDDQIAFWPIWPDQEATTSASWLAPYLCYQEEIPSEVREFLKGRGPNDFMVVLKLRNLADETDEEVDKIIAGAAEREAGSKTPEGSG